MANNDTSLTGKESRRAARHTLNIKRVYSDPAGDESDGLRIFVDRLWPRGESKEKFQYDIWAKDIAPSAELRVWYHADSENRWDEFAHRYRLELAANPAMGAFINELRPCPVITLLYSSRDEAHNNAVVLKDYLAGSL